MKVTWTIRQYAVLHRTPMFALTASDHNGVMLSFSGTRQEMDEAARLQGAKPEELPPITEEEFFSQAAAN
jgi:hypothetical protein